MKRSLIAIGLLVVAFASINFTGCHISITSMDGYSFDYKGVKAERSETEAISSSVEGLVIDNRFGDVKVEKTDGDASWSWDVSCWSNSAEEAEAFTKMVHIKAEESGTTQSIQVDLPDPDNNLRGIKSNITVLVPDKIKVEIKNTFGPATVKSISGTVKVNNKHGDIHVSECPGQSFLTTSFGDIDCSNVGPASVENKHGDVKIIGTSGEVTVDDEHGSISLKSISGNAKVRSKHTAVSIDTVDGEVDVTASFKKTEISSVSGNLHANSKHGDITAKNIQGDFKSKIEHGDLDYDGSAKTFTAVGSHAEINATLNDSAIKLVDVNTSFGDVTLTIPQSSKITLDLDADHGDVDADLSLPSGEGKAKVRCKFGDIEIHRK